MSRACGAVISDRFSGGEVKNLLFNYFEDSNEGIVSREEERRDMWDSRKTPHEWWCYQNCGMHVGNFLVHARLDYWILSQECRNTLPWHKLLNWWVHKIRRCCGWRGWSKRKVEPIARPNTWRPNLVKRGFMYSKQNWKWMLVRLWKNKNVG